MISNIEKDLPNNIEVGDGQVFTLRPAPKGYIMALKSHSAKAIPPARLTGAIAYKDTAPQAFNISFILPPFLSSVFLLTYILYHFMSI